MQSISTNLTPSCVFFQLLAIFFLSPYLSAQDEANYDETKVPQFELPALLLTQDGQMVNDSSEWIEKRRPQLLQLFEREMYGSFPGDHLTVDFILIGNEIVFDGRARRKQVVMQVGNGDDQVDINILIYLPTQITTPVPIFLGLNFYGNHTIHSDPGIVVPTSWTRNNEDFGITNHHPTEASRGVRASRWEVDSLLEHGFGLAAIYYGDIDPDIDDGFENGIHGLLPDDVDKSTLSSIAAWSWGLSRAMDFFEQERSIDHEKVIVIGHSRLGKTSLWAGATDERFAMVISNDSGCGGAALSRRRFGETVNRINHSFPHWFCKNFDVYNNREDALPFDQHGLIALIAPRPVYVASASEDLWADPRGEYLSAREASIVYQLFGKSGLENSAMPDVNSPIKMGSVGYHLRAGKHDINIYDWQQYLDFAQMHLMD